MQNQTQPNGTQANTSALRSQPTASTSELSNGSTRERKGTAGTLARTLQRITVSKFFWDAVAETFPALQKHPGYSRLFWYLLYGAWHDKETHRVLLESKLLSEMEGRDEQNTAAEKFLERFKADVLPPGARMSWSYPNHKRDKCRHLVELSFGSFDSVIENERKRHWHGQGRVYLNGTTFTEAKQRQIRRDEQASATLLPGLCADAQDIQNYLNELNPHLFLRALEQNLQSTLDVAMDLPTPNKEMEYVRQEQLRILGGIESQPIPFYTASENANTVRLFTRQSIANI